MQPMPETLRLQVDALATIIGKPTVAEGLEKASAPARKMCGTQLTLGKPRYYWADPER